VVELKASGDLHRPLEALDDRLRVKWRRERGELSTNGGLMDIFKLSNCEMRPPSSRRSRHR
jgi:hypothetical protein